MTTGPGTCTFRSPCGLGCGSVAGRVFIIMSKALGSIHSTANKKKQAARGTWPSPRQPRGAASGGQVPTVSMEELGSSSHRCHHGAPAWSVKQVITLVPSSGRKESRVYVFMSCYLLKQVWVLPDTGCRICTPSATCGLVYRLCAQQEIFSIFLKSFHVSV